MWIQLNNGFYSIVRTAYCPEGQLLVRARRAGDIEKLWVTAEVVMTKGCDYLYRAFIPEQEVADAHGLRGFSVSIKRLC